MTLVFSALPLLQNSKGNSLSGVLNTWKWEKFVILDKLPFISEGV